MAIQWFPGHMHKARVEMAELLPKVDLVIEILDARIPYSSENPMLAELRGDKPVLKVLAKSDLADPIRILSTLFGSASPLPAPETDCGVDPTPDSLSDCGEGCVG